MKNLIQYTFQKIVPTTADWDLIESAVDSTVFHCRGWSDYTSQMGFSPIVIKIQESDKLVGYFVGARKRVVFKIIMAPPMGTGTYSQGLCMFGSYTKQERIEIYIKLVQWFFETRQAIYIQLCDWKLRTESSELIDDWHDPDLDEKGVFYSPRSTFFLDIQKPIEELWANLQYKSCKYSINKARKNGLTVKMVEKEEDIDRFIDQHRLHLKEMQARNKTMGLLCQRRKNIEALCRSLFPDRIVMMEVVGPDESGRTVSMATGIFANGNSGSTYFTGASYKEYMHFCPNELLIWEAIRALHERNAGSLIFGGNGHYKKKYGSIYAYVPVMAFTKYPFLFKAYHIVRKAYDLMASFVGRIKK